MIGTKFSRKATVPHKTGSPTPVSHLTAAVANPTAAFMPVIVTKRAPKFLALGLGSSQPRPNTLLDHRPLKFGEHTHHLKHGLSCQRGGVETLLVQIQVDLERVNLG